MANPNDRNTRKARASIKADHANGAAKASKPGTAAKPATEKSVGINLGAISTDNRLPGLLDHLNEGVALVVGNTAQGRRGWYEVGKALCEIEETFFAKRGEDGELLKSEKTGRLVVDDKAMGKFLDERGFNRGIIAHPNARGAAKWFYRNAEEVARIANKFADRDPLAGLNHPLHIRDKVGKLLEAEGRYADDLDRVLDSYYAAIKPAKVSGGGSSKETDTKSEQLQAKLDAARAEIAALKAKLKAEEEAHARTKLAYKALQEEAKAAGLSAGVFSDEAAKADEAAVPDFLKKGKAKAQPVAQVAGPAPAEQVEDAEWSDAAPKAAAPLALPAPEAKPAKPAKASKAQAAKAAKVAKAKPAPKGKAKAAQDDAAQGDLI